jgi:NTP pyrophosphatase (non-canonical NTP hydrolase)
MTEELKKACLQILKHYGFEDQREILVEECAELIQLVSKMKRNGEKISNNFIEELADVSIMIEQMRQALNDEETAQFLKMQDYKINRQIARIKGGLIHNCTNCSRTCTERSDDNKYCGNYMAK